MSTSRVEIHPEAFEEMSVALDWYAERSTRAPVAFLDEIDRAISAILEAPNRWPVYDGDCRRLILSRFPYFIVYREKIPGLIQSLAVAHGRRQPGYWHTRTL